MMRAPDSMQSKIAPASSWGVALGISPLGEADSAKIGRTSRVQLGQIAGAVEFRLPDRMPATKVPCLQAVLLPREHAPENFPESAWMFSPAKPGWSIATGPSMSATLIRASPLVIFISGVSL